MIIIASKDIYAAAEAQNYPLVEYQSSCRRVWNPFISAIDSNKPASAPFSHRMYAHVYMRDSEYYYIYFHFFRPDETMLVA